MACICSWMFVCMYVLACMLCLIWGCDALVLRRQEALVAPSWAQSCLTMEECWRGCRASAFFLDAPHATHPLMKSYKRLQRCQKNTNKTRALVFGVAFFLFVFFFQTESLRVWRECTCRCSISVDTAVTCKFPGGPKPLWGAWGPRAKLC